MKIKLFFILSLIGVLPVSAQTTFRPVSSVDDFKKQLSSATSSVNTLECNFKQTKYLDILNEKVVSEGKFYYKKEHRICLDYLTPSNYQVIINKDKIQITSGGKVNVYDVGKNKMMSQMNVLMSACMTGNLNGLSADYRLTFSENDAQYRIIIQPVAVKKSFIKSMEVLLDKKDFSVQQILMIESSSEDSTTYVFSNKKKNVSIPDTKFNISGR
jgi:outer membrane lipoprotein-sorting protein